MTITGPKPARVTAAFVFFVRSAIGSQTLRRSAAPIAFTVSAGSRFPTGTPPTVMPSGSVCGTVTVVVVPTVVVPIVVVVPTVVVVGTVVVVAPTKDGLPLANAYAARTPAAAQAQST